ncbi:MAG: hypothetical protein DCC67_09475 [Planctomycetota bacterium]|nr:MAG: hypothetical protein DCC67_09475 [Planctomycetota bacterium]
MRKAECGFGNAECGMRNSDCECGFRNAGFGMQWRRAASVLGIPQSAIRIPQSLWAIRNPQSEFRNR